VTEIRKTLKGRKSNVRSFFVSIPVRKLCRISLSQIRTVSISLEKFRNGVDYLLLEYFEEPDDYSTENADCRSGKYIAFTA
jgi:hypothetical protein